MANKLMSKAISKSKRMKLEDAARLYLKVLKTDPNNLDANYLLGTIFAEMGKLEKALAYLRKAEQIFPGSPYVQVNLGNVYKLLHSDDSALNHFRLAAAAKPDLPEAYFGIGTVAGDDLTATGNLRKAVELKPDFAEAHQMLGRVLFKSKQIEALECFSRAVALKPRLRKIYDDYGRALLVFEKVGEAAQVFRAGLAANPGNAILEYFGEIAEGRQPSVERHARFVEREFDELAPAYDHVWLRERQYDAPTLVVQEIQEQLGSNFSSVSALDLGCGTGLGGEKIRQHAQTLTGVDISSGMLKLATARGCYDHLIHQDMTGFLETTEARFDLFLALDSFIYMDDITPVLNQAVRNAAPNALFAFTVEAYDGEGIALQLSGRYAHSPGYVKELAAECGCTIVLQKRFPLRQECGESLQGDMYLLRLP